jgi:hypothetical protein
MTDSYPTSACADTDSAKIMIFFSGFVHTVAQASERANAWLEISGSQATTRGTATDAKWVAKSLCH